MIAKVDLAAWITTTDAHVRALEATLRLVDRDGPLITHNRVATATQALRDQVDALAAALSTKGSPDA